VHVCMYLYFLYFFQVEKNVQLKMHAEVNDEILTDFFCNTMPENEVWQTSVNNNVRFY